MFKIFCSILLHFVKRPDKILITMLLPFFIIFTLNISENLKQYRDFMFDK
jgi:hypothetical protein